MRLDQIEKAREERRRAEEANDPSAEKAHERRAERSDYLREKLAERAEAEDAAATEDED